MLNIMNVLGTDGAGDILPPHIRLYWMNASLPPVGLELRDMTEISSNQSVDPMTDWHMITMKQMYWRNKEMH